MKKATVPAVVAVWTSHQGVPAATTLVNRLIHSNDLFIGKGSKAPIGREVLGKIITTFTMKDQWVLSINMKSGMCISEYVTSLVEDLSKSTCMRIFSGILYAHTFVLYQVSFIIIIIEIA